MCYATKITYIFFLHADACCSLLLAPTQHAKISVNADIECAGLQHSQSVNLLSIPTATADWLSDCTCVLQGTCP